MSHFARLSVDGVEVAVLRNQIPLGWPLLLVPDEVELLDRVEYGEAFQQVRARAAGDAVVQRLQRLSALSHPIFQGAARVIPLFEGVDEVVFDVDEIDQLGDTGWTLEPLRLGASVLEADLDGLEALADVLGYGWWLQDPEHRMATRLTEMDWVRETIQTLTFGYPVDAGPFEAWWQQGPRAPQVSSASDDAEQLLQALEAAGVVQVLNPKWALRFLTVAMRSRELGMVLGCLEAAERARNLERKRRWLGLGQAPDWDQTLLTRLLAESPD